MRIGWLLAVGLVLTGCSKELAQCEDAIKAKLRSPATYKTVSSECSAGLSCEIKFDAANAYGAPIREEAKCYLAGGRAQVFLESEMRSGIEETTRPLR